MAEEKPDLSTAINPDSLPSIGADQQGNTQPQVSQLPTSPLNGNSKINKPKIIKRLIWIYIVWLVVCIFFTRFLFNLLFLSPHLQILGGPLIIVQALIMIMLVNPLNIALVVVNLFAFSIYGAKSIAFAHATDKIIAFLTFIGAIIFTLYGLFETINYSACTAKLGGSENLCGVGLIIGLALFLPTFILAFFNLKVISKYISQT